MVNQIKNSALILLTILIAGCVTSINTSDHQVLKSEQVVYVSHHYKGDEARYIVKILEILEKHDFEITRYDPHAKYDLGFMMSGLEAEIILKMGREVIIQVNSHRYVEEILPIRHEVVNRAIDKFDEALGQMLYD